MTPDAHVSDLLRPVHVRSERSIHLALDDWGEAGGDIRTLCGQPVQAIGRTATFLMTGCLRCAERAAGAGMLLVSDGTSVIGLCRFIRQRSKNTP